MRPPSRFRRWIRGGSAGAARRTAGRGCGLTSPRPRCGRGPRCSKELRGEIEGRLDRRRAQQPKLRARGRDVEAAALRQDSAPGDIGADQAAGTPRERRRGCSTGRALHRPGARRTPSAIAGASPIATVRSGSDDGEAYAASWPTRRHASPIVVPISPVPTTAIFVHARSWGRERFGPDSPSSGPIICCGAHAPLICALARGVSGCSLVCPAQPPPSPHREALLPSLRRGPPAVRGRSTDRRARNLRVASYGSAHKIDGFAPTPTGSARSSVRLRAIRHEEERRTGTKRRRSRRSPRWGRPSSRAACRP